MSVNATRMELLDRKTGLSLGEAVFRALRQALRSGQYRSGDRLREDEIAQTLKVSRTPVREALNRLMATGFIEQASGRGLVVRHLDIAEVLELYAMREILEGAAARLASRHASLAEIEALNDLEGRFEALNDDPAEMAKVNRTFHETIFRAAKNRYLDGALEELQDGISLLHPTTFTVQQRPGTAANEHREIIAAITGRDADRAEQMARLHIQESLRTRLRLFNS
ncbi:GntR family transcriptional regulator [Phyllobacterium sp. SB3]|uniref:GntR family transcriptional regulator n=1 Tax=Phyllobacterium sp. SB3 TaxID=3156073 RepID=UPI0032AE9623